MPSVSSKSTPSRGYFKNNSSNRKLIQKISSEFELDNSPTENTNLLKKENLNEMNEIADRHIDIMRARSHILGKHILQKSKSSKSKTAKLRQAVLDNPDDTIPPYPNGGKRKKRVSYRRRRKI